MIAFCTNSVRRKAGGEECEIEGQQQLSKDRAHGGGRPPRKRTEPWAQHLSGFSHDRTCGLEYCIHPANFETTSSV